MWFLKQTVRRLSTKSLHFILGSLPPILRKSFGIALVNTHGSVAGRKLLGWYAEDRPVDAYLVSFPKCGRTWLRLMLGYVFVSQFDLCHPEIQAKMIKLEPLAQLNPAVPRIRVVHDDTPHWKKPHELEISKYQYQRSKVIFLARDPRDVVVSAYFEQKKRMPMWQDEAKRAQDTSNNIYHERLQPFEGDLSTFLYEDVGSFNTLLRYYNIWAENRNVPASFLLVRYEDMHENPKRELSRVLKFLGIPYVSDEIISEAVDNASFNNMRKLEVENAFNSRHLKPADIEDENSYKTRKGIVGGFVDYFNQDEIAYMDKQILERLPVLFGYNS